MTADPTAPLLIDDRAAARMAGIGRATLHRLRASGAWGPAAVRLGRAVRYRRAEVEEWIQAGCPDAATWRALRSQARRLRAI